jgi:hypothetical protein
MSIDRILQRTKEHNVSETGPVSETLSFATFKNINRWAKSKLPAILKIKTNTNKCVNLILQNDSELAVIHSPDGNCITHLLQKC